MGSRVANNPINIPSGVEVTSQANAVSVKGSKGNLHYSLHHLVTIEKEGNVLTIKALNESIEANAQAGTTRAIINNMVNGVSKGFERKLVLVGVGYRAAAQGKVLNLSLGFSHPVVFPVPEGITIETPSQTEILVKGADKRLVGQVAANIRSIRPPEPYKGKGVRYADEKVIIKETKKK
ncbi:MAG: 50S ribosomal protein L6 [Legionellales bacterium]|nr:50S ribosomal protein L6 [Legionellales bacterium]